MEKLALWWQLQAFFLVSRNVAAAQTLVLQLTEQTHPPISLVLFSLADPFYTSFVEFTAYLKVTKLFSPKHTASSLSQVLVNNHFLCFIAFGDLLVH